MKNNNSLRVVSHPAAPESGSLSPARDRLRSLLEQRAGHQRKIKELSAAADRLTEIFQARDQAAADVIAFDKQSTANLLEWSQQHLKAAGSEPMVDSDKRLALLTALAQAKENSDAAERARVQITASIQTEGVAAKSLETDITQAVAEILAETASGPLMDEFRAAQYRVAVLKSKLDQALATVFGIANKGEQGNPAFNVAANLAEVFRTTAQPGLELGAGFADRQAWETFATALRTDPSAELNP